MATSILGGAAGVSATALYSAHAPIPVLSRYDHPITRGTLAFLSGVADTLQDIALPSPVLGLYCAATGADNCEYGSIRAFRARPIPQNTNIKGTRDVMLAPISGEILATGSVGTGGAILGTKIRDVLGAEDNDPISARGVRVTQEDIDGYTDYSIRYVQIRPRVSDSLYTLAPTDVTHVRVKTIPGSLSEYSTHLSERAVYSGAWDGGLLALVALSGPGRRHTKQKDVATDVDVARRMPITPAPQAASLIVLFECADDGFVSLVKVGDRVTAGEPLAKVSHIKQASDTNKAITSERELEEYKERRGSTVGKRTGRVRRSW